MSTKVQKIFAKFIRTKNPHERDALKRKLKGVKASEVSYTKNGKQYTVHGNIPWTQPNDKKSKPKPIHVSYSYPGTGPRRKGWVPPKPKPSKKTRKEFQREQSDFEARSTIKRRNKGLF